MESVQKKVYRNVDRILCNDPAYMLMPDLSYLGFLRLSVRSR